MVGEVREDSQIIVYSPVTSVPRCNGSNAKTESSVSPITNKIQNLKKKKLITGRILLGYLYGKGFGWKPLVRRTNREGAWPSRETGYWGQRPQVEASSTYVREKRRCVEARHGSHGIAIRVAVSALHRWTVDCFTTRPRPLLPIGLGYLGAKPFPI